VDAALAATRAPVIGSPLIALVTVPVSVPVGPIEQLGNLNDPMRVYQFQLPPPVYSCVYQKVQSSVGSICIAL
jgi:hypothetical protein